MKIQTYLLFNGSLYGAECKSPAIDTWVGLKSQSKAHYGHGVSQFNTGVCIMMTMSNCVYGSLKRKGMHNWGFLNIRQSDFDFKNVDLDALDLSDMDLFFFDSDEQGGFSL